MRFKFLDLVLFILLFIFVAAFPVNLITSDPAYQLLIQIGLRLLILAYYIYLIVKNHIKIFKIANIRNALLCLPFAIIGLSNIFAALAEGGFTFNPLDGGYITLIIIYHLISVSIEEIVFRVFIHHALINTTSTKRIFASAGIFALIHLVNLANNFTSISGLIIVLEQVLYTFVLGLLLGLLYEYSHSLIACIGLHFSFNFFNTILVQILGAYYSDISYYVSAIICGAVVIIYMAIIWIFIFKRPEKYYRN